VNLSGDDEWHTLGLADAHDDTELVNRFITRFNPSDGLRKAWTDYVRSGHLDVRSLAGTDLHVVTETSGTALCVSFMFFETPKGRAAQLLPDLPLKSDHDGDNLICNNTGGDGYLARIGDVTAFLETHTSDNKSYYRVVPLQDGKWASACAVEAEYETKYRTSKTFVPAGGALTIDDLNNLASQIVEKRERVQDVKDFSFGPPLAESDQIQVRTMMGLVDKLNDESFPTFGRNQDLDVGEETLRSADSFPILLNGKPYLLRVGLGQLGCCSFPGPLLIFYTLKDGKLEPAGSAVVEKSRGALRSARAIASR
jgi:hypothetical protein